MYKHSKRANSPQLSIDQYGTMTPCVPFIMAALQPIKRFFGSAYLLHKILYDLSMEKIRLINNNIKASRASLTIPTSVGPNILRFMVKVLHFHGFVWTINYQVETFKENVFTTRYIVYENMS